MSNGPSSWHNRDHQLIHEYNLIAADCLANCFSKQMVKTRGKVESGTHRPLYLLCNALVPYINWIGEWLILSRKGIALPSKFSEIMNLLANPKTRFQQMSSARGGTLYHHFAYVELIYQYLSECSGRIQHRHLYMYIVVLCTPHQVGCYATICIRVPVSCAQELTLS